MVHGYGENCLSCVNIRILALNRRAIFFCALTRNVRKLFVIMILFYILIFDLYFKHVYAKVLFWCHHGFHLMNDCMRVECCQESRTFSLSIMH